MFSVFGKTKELEEKIGEFLDTITEATIQFRQAMKYYMDEKYDEFDEKAKYIDELESKADELRRGIENKLYSEMLIPEARGDVLALLENSDDVMNILADTIIEFSVEKPEFLPEIEKDFLDLVDVALNAVDEMVATVRCYFTDLAAVPHHIAKIRVYENESDKVGEKIKRYVFSKDDLRLSHKMQLRTFVSLIEEIADKAEDVGDRVAIYRIKRIV